MEERRKKIVDLVDAEGQITFAQLKSAFPNVSEMTLHTDLKHLNESGRIVRVHGGARSAEIVAGAEDFFPSGFNGIESKSKQSLKRPLPCFKRIELSFWIPALQHRDHQQPHAESLRQRQHREQRGDADHGDVPQQPEPQHELGFEIIRIDKHGDFPYCFCKKKTV